MRIDKLKLNYRKTCESCIIISLVIIIILIQVVRQSSDYNSQQKIVQIKIEIVKMPKTWQKKKIRRPIEPNRPTIPIPLEEEYIPEDLDIVSTELYLSNIPPPPAPPIEEYDYENYSFISYQIPPTIIGGIRSVRRLINYPRIAKLIGLEGQTILGLLIDKHGHVIKCVIIKSAGFLEFDEEATRVAMKIRFKPAFQRDRAVKVWLALPFKFRLR